VWFFFFTSYYIIVWTVKVHPILFFIMCLPLRDIIGYGEEWFRFQEGDIHSHIKPTGRGIIASVALLMHGVTQEETSESTWVQFGALILVKVYISHAPKYSGREHEGRV
jgi:hypothetical protein